MKKLLIVFVLGGVLISGVFVGANTLGSSEAFTCPDGSYAIDEGVCKQEPTGCPYGDSIPLDSPKCVPTTPEEKAAVEPVPQPESQTTETSTCQQ